MPERYSNAGRRQSIAAVLSDPDPYQPPAAEDALSPVLAPARGPGLLAAVLALAAAAAGIIGGSWLIRHQTSAALHVLVPQMAVLLVVAGTMLIGRWRPRACGMARTQPPYLLAGMALAPVMVLVGLGLGLATVALLGPPPAAIRGIDEMLMRIHRQAGWWQLALLTGVLPGLGEEMLMRGIVLTGLRRRCSAGAAVVISALAFAALHGSPWRFLPQLGLGLVLGWLAVRTGSCWPGAFCHAAYNLLTLAFAMAVIGQRKAAAGLIALALLAAAPIGLIAAWRILRRRGAMMG